MKCRVCNSPSKDPIFFGFIFDQKVQYFDCETCGYVQTGNPTWLSKAYESPINSCDTGILRRNQWNVNLVLATLASLNSRFSRVVDYAGGYGILVRLLRDQGIDAFWSDPYCQNLLAIGFENKNKQAALVTAFEAFEHFVNPRLEIEKMLSIGSNILFSTELIAEPAPQPESWWYYGLSHGQHIGFFRERTLRYLARKFGMNLITDGARYHLLSHNAPHYLHWRMSLFLARFFPSVLKCGMKSKVWLDHDFMIKK